MSKKKKQPDENRQPDVAIKDLIVKIMRQNGRVDLDDVEKFFGSEDIDSEVKFGPPATRLWKFVLDSFTPVSNRRVAAGEGNFACDKWAISSAIKYIDAVLRYSGGVLGREGVGLLESAQCFLYGRLASLSTAIDRHNLNEALRLNRGAISLLDAPHNEKLRRKMQITLVKNLAMRRAWNEVSGPLVSSCRGLPENAMPSLYFQAACWYFHLYPNQQTPVLEQIRDDLALAYAQIPALVAQKSFGGGDAAADETEMIAVDDEQDEEEALIVLAPPAEWNRSALDRLGVVAMLASDPVSSKARDFWRYEAVQLYQDWLPHIQRFASNEARDEESGRLLAFLGEMQSRIKGMPQPDPHHYNVEDHSVGVREAVKKKSPETEAYCRNLLKTISPTEEPIWWQYVSNGLAWAVARNTSIEGGLKEFDRCQSRLPAWPRTEAQRAALGRFLCRKASLLNQAGRHGEVEPLLRQAAIHAGRAADLIEIERIADLQARTRSFLSLEMDKNEARNVSITIKHSFPTFLTTLFDRERPATSERALELLLRAEAGEADKTQDAFDLRDRLRNNPGEIDNVNAADLSKFFAWSKPLVARRAVREAAEAILLHSRDPEVRRIAAENYLSILADAKRSLAGKSKSRFISQFVNALSILLDGSKSINADSVARVVADVKEGEWRNDLLQLEIQDGDIPSLSLFSWEEARQHLRTSHACVVDFFITSNLALAICISSSGTEIFPIQATSQRLASSYSDLQSLASAAGVPVLPGTKRPPLEILHLYSNDNIEDGEARRNLWDEAWKVWRDYGKIVLPREVEDFISRFDLVYLSPHHSLSKIPIHLLPLADGRPLAFAKRVLYLPSIHKLTQDAPSPKAGSYAAINPEEDPGAILSALPKEERDNRWSERINPVDRLDEMAQKRLAVLFMHGMYERDYPIRTRLGFPRGARLTLADVKRSSQHFSGTELYLVGCNSGRVRSSKGQAELAFCTAFLDRGADATLGCLWETRKDEAVVFTTLMLEHRYSSESRSSAFQKAIQAICSKVEHPMEKVVRAAPFVLYGLESDSRP